MSTYNPDIDNYIDQFNGVTHERLLQLRQLMFKLVPEATERISYKIPAYFLDKKLIIYFAGYAHHTGIYPGRVGPKEVGEKLAPYLSGKSTLKFPNDKPLPLELIELFVRQRIAES